MHGLQLSGGAVLAYSPALIIDVKVAKANISFLAGYQNTYLHNGPYFYNKSM